MMEAGRCVEVLNFYDWLPGYGENSVQLFTEKLDLTVVIEYDGQDDKIEKKELRFKQVCAFYKGAFPGPHMFDFSYSVESRAPIFGHLVEFPDSEAAHIWAQHFANSRVVKHYKVIFLSENIMLEIFASDVILQDVVNQN